MHSSFSLSRVLIMISFQRNCKTSFKIFYIVKQHVPYELYMRSTVMHGLKLYSDCPFLSSSILNSILPKKDLHRCQFTKQCWALSHNEIECALIILLVCILDDTLFSTPPPLRCLLLPAAPRVQTLWDASHCRQDTVYNRWEYVRHHTHSNVQLIVCSTDS